MFERLSITWIVLAVMPGAATGAESLSDPMRPWSEPPAARTTTRPSLELSAIIFSSERRIAILTGQPVAEGDKVAGALVRRINRRDLELVVGDRVVELELKDTAGKKFKRSSP